MSPAQELEQQMMVNDRMEHERVDAKNALEVCEAPHDAIMAPFVCGPAPW
jgi:hypothetical protein